MANLEKARAYFCARNNSDDSDEDFKIRCEYLKECGLDFTNISEDKAIIILYTLAECFSGDIISFDTYDKIDSEIGEYMDKCDAEEKEEREAIREEIRASNYAAIRKLKGRN